MAVSGRIQRRLALAIVLTALIPVLVAIWLAGSAVRQTGARFFVPEIGTHLDRSLGLYQELARTVKALMRQQATSIALRPELQRAVNENDKALLERELRAAFVEHSGLVSLSVRTENQPMLARVQRDKPLDTTRENDLEVVRTLAETDDGIVELVAVFAADKARFDELTEMSQFVDTYKKIERRREADEKSFMHAFALLLGITILAAVGVGTLLARSVSARIGELAQATKLVADGDLSIRVPERGSDEISDLARAFNGMLAEVELTRARIEYLQRISAWQEMARRLAHEIKNPLTPIQLAVQEIHRRYSGEDPAYRKLVDTTLEIVEDEVGTLRRLVSEFSNFARLPQADLEPADLAAFLGELKQQLLVGEDVEGAESGDALRGIGLSDARVDLEFELPEESAEVLMDRQMLRRVLINLVRNAVQAVDNKQGERGQVMVRLTREGEFWNLDVDDNGPGIPEDMRQTVFDPYVTTKALGTGLGLAIVKKIVIEHGGNIYARQSPQGGARLRVRLPALGTRAAIRAREMQDNAVPQSRRPVEDAMRSG